MKLILRLISSLSELMNILETGKCVVCTALLVPALIDKIRITLAKKAEGLELPDSIDLMAARASLDLARMVALSSTEEDNPDQSLAVMMPAIVSLLQFVEFTARQRLAEVVQPAIEEAMKEGLLEQIASSGHVVQAA